MDPAFTCLVWQKLLDQNPNFFYGYALRLRLKDQIVAFNYLIDQHSKMITPLDQQGGAGGGSASTAQANQLMGGLQQQQLNDLKQLQQYYAMQHNYHAQEQQNSMTALQQQQQFQLPHGMQQQQQQQQVVPSGVVSAPVIPGLSPDEPLSLDPQSLGSGGLAENSLLTPMIHAAAQAGQTTFFPPTPAAGAQHTAL